MNDVCYTTKMMSCQRNGGSGSRRQPQQHQSRQTAAASSSAQHSFRNVDNQMVNLIMNEIMDHGPRVGFDDIGLCAAPLLVGRIADLARPSVRLCVPYGLLSLANENAQNQNWCEHPRRQNLQK